MDDFLADRQLGRRNNLGRSSL